jgi:hypothetical protein
MVVLCVNAYYLASTQLNEGTEPTEIVKMMTLTKDNTSNFKG